LAQDVFYKEIKYKVGKPEDEYKKELFAIPDAEIKLKQHWKLTPKPIPLSVETPDKQAKELINPPAEASKKKKEKGKEKDKGLSIIQFLDEDEQNKDIENLTDKKNLSSNIPDIPEIPPTVDLLSPNALMQLTPEDLELLQKQKDLELLEKPKKGTGIGDSTGLWSDEIDKIMDKYKKRGYKGTVSIDQIGNIQFNPKDKHISFIMNTTPSTSNKSGHWIAVYMNHDNLEYYDSFGDDPELKSKTETATIVDILPSSFYKIDMLVIILKIVLISK